MEKLEIPKFHETFNPILEVLSNGEIIHSRELQKIVLEKYYSHLPEDLLSEKTKSGEILKGVFCPHYPPSLNMYWRLSETEVATVVARYLNKKPLDQENRLF